MHPFFIVSTWVWFSQSISRPITITKHAKSTCWGGVLQPWMARQSRRSRWSELHPQLSCVRNDMTLLWYGFARYNFAISVAKTSDVHLRFSALYYGVASLQYVDFAIDVKNTGRILLSPSHISQINLFRNAIDLLGFTLPTVRCWVAALILKDLSWNDVSKKFDWAASKT